MLLFLFAFDHNALTMAYWPLFTYCFSSALATDSLISLHSQNTSVFNSLKNKETQKNVSYLKNYLLDSSFVMMKNHLFPRCLSKFNVDNL